MRDIGLALRLLAKVISERGYMVFVTFGTHPKGQEVTCVDPNLPGIWNHPFYVLGETDIDDFEEQRRVAGLPPQPRPDDGAIRHYYRAGTD